MSIIASKGNSANVTFTTPQELVISHTDDSIKIGNGANYLSVNTDGSINTAAVAYVTRLDEPSSTITYVGKAVAGTAAGAASWQITRLTTSGTELIMESAREFINQLPSMPRVYDGANLVWLLYHGAATPVNSAFYGHLELGWG